MTESKNNISYFSKIDVMKDLMDSIITLNLHPSILSNPLNKKEKEISELTLKILDGIIDISISNPQYLINYSKDFISRNEEMTTLFTKYKHISKVNFNIVKKIEAISIYWELSSILALPIFILSKGKEVVNSDTEPKHIFRHFKMFGLSSDDIEKLRIVRNSSNHLLKISENKNSIVYKKVEISFNEITYLYIKLSQLFKWYQELFGAIILGIPIAGLYLAYGVYFEISNNRYKYNSYIDTMKFIRPDYFASSNVKIEDAKIKYMNKNTRSRWVNRLKLRIYKFFYPNKYKLIEDFGNSLISTIVHHLFDRLELVVDKTIKLSADKIDKVHLADLYRLSDWLKLNKEKAKIGLENLGIK